MGSEAALARPTAERTKSIPHIKALPGSGHDCNDLKSSIDLLPLDYKSGVRLPYPDNAPPSCNEIYDCDLVSSNPARRYSGGSQNTCDPTASPVRMTTSEARKVKFLFRLKDNSPLDTIAKVKDMFCLDQDLHLATFNYDGEQLKYVRLDGVDKAVIQNHIVRVQLNVYSIH